MKMRIGYPTAKQAEANIKDMFPCPNQPTILEEAASIVAGSRNDEYGSPERNHDRIAKMWSAYLGVPVAPRDVCTMMILVKASRDRFKPKRDNAVDIAGYAYLMNEME